MQRETSNAVTVTPDADTGQGNQLARRAAVASQGAAVVTSYDEARQMAVALSHGAVAVPQAFRKNEGACMSVIVQAMGWGMNPVSLIQSAYVVGDNVGYEAKVFSALINLKAPLTKRLRFRYDGSLKFETKTTQRGGKMRTPTGDRTCTVIGWLEGEDEPIEYTTPPIGDIEPKNSTMWAGDPDRQLAYYATRAWARLYVPEVVFGLYTQDELVDHAETMQPARPTGQAVQELIDAEDRPAPKPVDDIPEAEVVTQEHEDICEPEGVPPSDPPQRAAEPPQEPQEEQTDPEGASDLTEEAQLLVDASKNAYKRRLANCTTKQEAVAEFKWLEGTPGWLHFTDGEMKYARSQCSKRQKELPGAGA